MIDVPFRHPGHNQTILDFINTSNETKNDKDALNDLYHRSYAQMFQDVFALWYLNFKRDGYFVEFGATDGITISNTYFLEKEFNWKGIVAEPAVVFHEQLRNNRDCHVDTSCVWHTSNETLIFDQAAFPEWSCISSFLNEVDIPNRGGSTEYEVSTISLVDLLKKYDAPNVIDYLSLDTEGSELAILEVFDFSKYTVNFISVEHNDHSRDPSYRTALYDFLTNKNYIRVLTELSGCDDWYVRAELTTNLETVGKTS
jgi:FkbM family methyltransferase